MDAKKNTGSPDFLDPGDDAPEFTEEMFNHAEIRHGDRIIRPYSGPGALHMELAAEQLELDADLLERLRQTGPGWQARLNDAIRVWLKLATPV